MSIDKDVMSAIQKKDADEQKAQNKPLINGADPATLTAPNEGVVVRITTGANGAVESMDMRILYS